MDYVWNWWIGHEYTMLRQKSCFHGGLSVCRPFIVLGRSAACREPKPYYSLTESDQQGSRAFTTECNGCLLPSNTGFFVEWILFRTKQLNFPAVSLSVCVLLVVQAATRQEPFAFFLTFVACGCGDFVCFSIASVRRLCCTCMHQPETSIAWTLTPWMGGMAVWAQGAHVRHEKGPTQHDVSCDPVWWTDKICFQMKMKHSRRFWY